MFANVMTKKIEMTKTEAAKAGKFGTPEYEELTTLMAQFPKFDIIVVKSSARKADHLKGLTYDYMEGYIKEHNEALLNEFYELCGKDEKGNKKSFGIHSSYGEVRMWFLTNFPEIEAFSDKLDEIMEKTRKARAELKKAA